MSWRYKYGNREDKRVNWWWDMDQVLLFGLKWVQGFNEWSMYEGKEEECIKQPHGVYIQLGPLTIACRLWMPKRVFVECD